MDDTPEHPEPLRILFALGLTAEFYAAPPERVAAIGSTLQTAFDDLAGRFGVQVLGTMDDDQTQVGPSDGWPWTCYILADAPDLDAATAVCNIVRETAVGEARLWRYISIEARVGHALFFGTR